MGFSFYKSIVINVQIDMICKEWKIVGFCCMYLCRVLPLLLPSADNTYVLLDC